MGQLKKKDSRPKTRRSRTVAHRQTQLPSICDGIKDLIPFVMDRKGQFEAVDAGIEEVTEYSRQSFLDRSVTLLEIVHPDDRQDVESSLDSAWDRDKYFQADFRVFTRQGRERWISMRGPVVPGQEESDPLLRGVISDITVSKEKELGLERADRVFRAALDGLCDGIGILSDQCGIKFINQAMSGMVCKLGGDSCNGSIEDVFRREDLFPLQTVDRGIEGCCGFEDRDIPALGKTFRARTFPIYSEGEPIGAMVHLRDITRISRMERRLKEASFRVKIIAQAANVAPLGIFILEDDEVEGARFRFVNEAFCKITGYDRDDILDMHVSDMPYSEEFEEVMSCYRRRLRGEVPNSEHELQFIRKDGTAIHVICMGASTLHEGKITTVGFLRDITSRKELQKTLELSQRLATLGKLSAEIAHEINNPMTSILTFNNLIDRILEQEPFPVHRIAELRDYIGYTSSEAKRCAKISKSLLDFSREHDVSLEEHSIHSILEKTLDILRHRTKFGDIKLVTSYGENIPLILCDYHRIQQVFCNILWNAIDAMPDGGVLSVATSFEPEEQKGANPQCRQGMVKVVVSDSGTGIPPENLDRIFEPFFSTKTEKSGVGLGLAVAYGIIKKHGGDIQVQSRPGMGTTFTVLLPAGAESLPPPEAEEEEDAG